MSKDQLKCLLFKNRFQEAMKVRRQNIQFHNRARARSMFVANANDIDEMLPKEAIKRQQHSVY